MNKIIKISKVNMKVELKDGKVIDVRVDSLNFVPKVGMEVNVKGTGTKMVVTKVTAKKTVSKKVPAKKAPTTKKKPATTKKTVAKKTTSKKVDEKPLIKDSMDTEPRKMEASEVILMSLEKRYVSKATYLVLCFFFGLIGIHKFYSGKVLLGVLYLFTGGLFGIGALVDFIRVIFKDSDENGHIVI